MADGQGFDGRGLVTGRRRRTINDPARAFDEATARVRVGLDEAQRLEEGLAADLHQCGRALKVAGREALAALEERRRAASQARERVQRHLALLVVKIGVRADDVRHVLNRDDGAGERRSFRLFNFAGRFGRRSHSDGGPDHRVSSAVVEQMLGEAEFLADIIEIQAAHLRRLRQQGEADLSLLFDHRLRLRETLPEAVFRRRSGQHDSDPSVRADERMRRALFVEKGLSSFEALIEDWSHAIRLLDVLKHKIAMDAEELFILHRVVRDVEHGRGSGLARGSAGGQAGMSGSVDGSGREGGMAPLAARLPHLQGGLLRMEKDRLIGRGLPALRQRVDDELRQLLGYHRDVAPVQGQ